MHSRTQERVERWDSRPFSGGYDGLGDLADDEFSGAVAAGGTWLFMLNGRVVGVVDGRIEDFDDAAGTVYLAPDPALPLLCSMEERGGDARGKYYTNETPLTEVDQTLQDGSFTGYLELSENVLSGDYYAVYYGGRRMAAAYIGNAERLLTGEEAFERAADEVGIYEVVDVDVEVIDVPEPAGGAESATADGDETPDIEGGPSAPGSATSEIEGGPSAPGSATSEIEEADPSPDPTDDYEDPSPTETSFDERAVDDPPASTGSPAADSAASDEDRGLDATGAEKSPVDAAETAEPADPTAPEGPDADVSTGTETNETSRPAGSEGASTATEEPGAGHRPDEPAAGDRRDPSREDPDSGARAEPDAGGITTSDDRRAEPTPPGITADASDGPGAAGADEAAEPMPAADPDDATDEPITAPSPDEPAAGSDEGESDAVIADPADDTDPGSEDDLEERFEEEAQWRETTSIPSLDPDRSESADAAGRASDASWHSQESGGRSGDEGGRRRRESASQSTGDDPSPSHGGAGPDADRTDRAASGSRGSAEPDGIDEPLESDMLEREDKIDQLKQRVDDLEGRREAIEEERDRLAEQRDELEAENEELRETVDRLRGRIADLENELDRLESVEEGTPEPAAAETGTQLSPGQALAGTNLFVRYGSKSQATLATAHEGDGDREDVAANLRLEHHTQFDGAAATVGGRPYEEFLTASMEFRFVDWLTRTLPFEIRDTGRADGLRDLYDAIPKIDRAELHSTIEVDVDAEDAPDRVSFDVVAFDKRGNPLVVANLNDSREPATEGMLEELENDASVLKASSGDLSAAFGVTSSFFEPAALELCENATSGGLLSRDSRLSHVKLSRKQGYHLCLVESRSGGFHMNVPEL